ncbi:Protein PHYLLO, chloroplastic, partial [Linum perenne]
SQLDVVGETNYHLQRHPSINAVWASLIVEECTRLGLTFFCIAPGSRSSPLAIAASTHPKATCIACFDERALAFHAVGYAKGSQNPAVIITSSGTAVSNLLPAVVEASQDFVPLLLLTADRPPELQDTGANQTINQVNHFGSFVRFFFSLPAPSDDIPARMVLTTLDSAVNWATSPPYGPVHINCPFREPLDGSPKKWMLSCLKGLDSWICKSEPFTKYIKVQHSGVTSNIPILTELIEIIQGANRGLLLICALDDEDEIWASLILAKHLNWPVVADILSGLRVRKVLATCPEIQENVVFLDHLDHVLLSNSVKRWIQFDVILQIGTRTTSKRISQMLEDCNPHSYILVDNHPRRHDPSHVVSHRIQSSIVQFVDNLIKVQFQHASRSFYSHLQALNKMVAWDISFQISAERSLTEPHVAHVISEILDAEFALFVGNSMPIRDSDMYGRSWKHQTHTNSGILSCSELPCTGIRVSGNRGASGIDGLLSTATGFATGCNRRVLCLIGDVSFLHDTNGLALLNCRIRRKPVTVVVINNHGGAIFGLLPIADRTSPTVLSQYFYTSHDISIQKLCLAHSVRHILVKKKAELRDALLSSQDDVSDCVIEVESGIDANTNFHSTLRQSARQAADNALSSLLRLSVPSSNGFLFCKIHKMNYSLYRILLGAPTTASSPSDGNEFHKEGYVLSLFLDDGTVGYGEVAPLEIHEESLADAEEQLRFLCHVIEEAKISCTLPLLKGTFTSWLWNNLGIPEFSIFPSVRCGLEMAILNAMAARTGSSLLDILLPQKATEETHEMSEHVKLCALLDSNGTPHEVAYIAASLVAEGFTAIKLKVARRENPIEDAAVLQEVRKTVGQQIQLRVDANRKWTFEEAILFASLVQDSDLQYIEEPVQNEEEIIKYCNESVLPVALDETIDSLTGNPLDMLVKYAHPKIVAVVIKPSVVGGFEKAALIARWAQKEGKMAVVSAAFESGLALSTYALFSCYLEMNHADLSRVGSSPSIAHGLGTYRWLQQDTSTQQLRVSPDPYSGSMGVSTTAAIQHLQQFQLDDNIICRTFSGEEVGMYTLAVKTNELSCSIRIREVGRTNPRHDNVVIFLHGFLGTGEDWIPIMKAISGSARCISVDLPGHGETKVQNQDQTWSIERVSDVLYKLIEDLTPGSVTLVGYSMGARIALHMALRHDDKINGAVIISGSPGLNDETARKIRRAKDDSRARNLVTYGLQTFLRSWYDGKLWRCLRCHPRFKEVVASRSQNGDPLILAKALSDLSIGRQEPLWDDLKHSKAKLPILFVVGAHDDKFKTIARRMLDEINQAKNKVEDVTVSNNCEILEVPESGHAVHLENPLPLIHALSHFVTRITDDSGPDYNQQL